MFNAATERKKYLHREMAKLSRQLWPKYFGKAAPACRLARADRQDDRYAIYQTR